MRLLYFAPLSFGGLADYARDQAAALARRGIEVEVLCAPAFPKLPDGIRRNDSLDDPGNKAGGGRLARAGRFFKTMVGQHRQLARVISQSAHRHVLLGSYAEYFAPFWSPALRRLAREGAVFGAVVHDPVRDAVLGPKQWHRRSVADGYSFLKYAFVHESVALDTVRPMPGLEMLVIPHGPYHFETEMPERRVAREKLGLPADAPVLLAFGHIRDNKNLDLVIRALAEAPELRLLVAGHELSSGQRPASAYRKLAQQLGVANRCHWHVRFIPEKEIGCFFAAADFLALTYGAGFRSASGVLSVSSQFRKPCVASSGAGPLRTLVQKYQLGVWVAPDDAEALAKGLRQLLAEGVHPRWDAFVRENS
ncbi:MAG: glycosyltransferase family 4 protein, partial [Opitutaceae bacterium]